MPAVESLATGSARSSSKPLHSNTLKLRKPLVGDPLYRQSLCTDNDLYVPINPIRNIRVINGDTSYDCSPDANGNFNIQMNNALTEDAALRIETIPEGIVFAVKGSTPSVD